MKKIAFLLFGILLFSGCTKKQVGDFIVDATLTKIRNNGTNNKEKQCEKYSTAFEWQTEKSGKTIEIVKKGNILYVLKEIYNNYFELSEIDNKTGDILQSEKFRTTDKEKINENSDSNPNNILFMGKKGYGDMIVAYDYEKHTVLWYKEREEIDMQTINGYLYSKNYDWENGKRIFFLSQIDPVTGIEQKIYTFQDSLDDLSLNEIEDINPYSDDLGHLYFVFAGLYSKDIYETHVKIRVLDLSNNVITDIYSFTMDHGNLTFDCVDIDEENIYVNAEDDIFCYDRFTFENKWNSYSTEERGGNINSLAIIENYLFLSSASNIKVKDKFTGETIVSKKELWSNDKSFGIYNDMIYFTDGNLFYRINIDGVELDKFVSPAYCDGESSNIKFVINDSGDIFLSDKKYVMKKEF